MGTLDEINVSDRAADKLAAEKQAVLDKRKGTSFTDIAMRCLAEPIAAMLTRFCYQNEEFAQGVISSKGTLYECLDGILKKETKDSPMISDLEAYIMAVKFYLPAARVQASFRVELPEERDDDLLCLSEPDSLAEPSGGAIILDLFGAEKA
ncbi:MAG: hypothetical protein E7589_01400 [Ruminococcaceae bacterium]|nr:hypothetical protein [Oscillospiraceae bacterium]